MADAMEMVPTICVVTPDHREFEEYVNWRSRAEGRNVRMIEHCEQAQFLDNGQRIIRVTSGARIRGMHNIEVILHHNWQRLLQHHLIDIAQCNARHGTRPHLTEQIERYLVNTWGTRTPQQAKTDPPKNHANPWWIAEDK